MQLVELTFDRQVRSLAAYISEIEHKGATQFSLKAEATLLRVGPKCVCRNGGDIEWKDGAGWGRRSTLDACTSDVGRIKHRPIADVTDAGVTDRKLLRHAEHDGRARL